MEPSFHLCPNCGAPAGPWLKEHEFWCRACGFRYFQNVAAACGVLIEHQGEYLFLERAREPSAGLWGLPGGFVDPMESLEEALSREIAEEIGGEVEGLEYLNSFPNRYQFERVTYWTCDVYFKAKLVSSPKSLRPEPSEVTRILWKKASEVNPERLAFASLRQLWLSLSGPLLSR